MPEHAELAWLLNCFTMFGELSRMTQFKDKSAKHADNINAGLFTYPVLMAADILLYQTDVVPVGIDQKQHVEICRDIANRFNQIYPDTFTIPEPIIARHGMKIMSLAEPTKENVQVGRERERRRAYSDDRDTIIRKFRRAVTDSDAVVRYAEGKDGINNLMTIYAALTGKDMAEIEREFDGRGYGDFKTAVGETCADVLAPGAGALPRPTLPTRQCWRRNEKGRRRGFLRRPPHAVKSAEKSWDLSSCTESSRNRCFSRGALLTEGAPGLFCRLLSLLSIFPFPSSPARVRCLAMHHAGFRRRLAAPAITPPRGFRRTAALPSDLRPCAARRLPYSGAPRPEYPRAARRHPGCRCPGCPHADRS